MLIIITSPGGFKILASHYINLDSFFRLNKFVELLNDIYILAQNPFLAAFDEITQFLVSVIIIIVIIIIICRNFTVTDQVLWSLAQDDCQFVDGICIQL